MTGPQTAMLMFVCFCFGAVLGVISAMLISACVERAAVAGADVKGRDDG